MFFVRRDDSFEEPCGCLFGGGGHHEHGHHNHHHDHHGHHGRPHPEFHGGMRHHHHHHFRRRLIRGFGCLTIVFALITAALIGKTK